MAFLAITMMRDWKNFMNLQGGIEARVNLREEIWLTIVVGKFRPPIDLTIPFFLLSITNYNQRISVEYQNIDFQAQLEAAVASLKVCSL